MHLQIKCRKKEKQVLNVSVLFWHSGRGGEFVVYANNAPEGINTKELHFDFLVFIKLLPYVRKAIS